MQCYRAGFNFDGAREFGRTSRVAMIIRDCTLLRELGVPEDIANLAVFLVSKRAKFITAQVIQCDGGTFDHNPVRYGLRKLSIEDKGLRPVDSE